MVVDAIADPGPVANASGRARLAAWLLGWPLSVALTLLVLGQFATWAPHYLNWPLYADHDVFASAARAWDAGERPYRDFLCNNLPATIYLWWGLGKCFGWGKTTPFFAVDAGLVLGFCLLLVIWSRRRFGRALPGLVGVVALLSYLLELSYALAGQRDWHTACFAMAGLLVAQAWPGRRGWLISAACLAIALLCRPQAVVFLPAYLAQSLTAARDGRSAGRWLLEGTMVAGLVLLLGLAPLLAQGLIGDFVRSLRLTAPGSTYNRLTPLGFVSELVKQANSARLVLVPVLLLLVEGSTRPATRSLIRVWLVATLGVLVYKPMSPFPHVYLDHPLQVVWAIDCALLAAVALDAVSWPSLVRLAAILLILAPGMTLKPRFCEPGGLAGALSRAGRGQGASVEPSGYRPTPGMPSAAHYRWEDYHATLEDLRSRGPGITVANALKEAPALTGSTGQLSAFPAESIAWLKMVRREDEAAFARVLERASAAVVVWIPGEIGLNPSFQIPQIEQVIRRDFQLDARHGAIEIWVRAARPDPPIDPTRLE